jgi:hypothetical protein
MGFTRPAVALAVAALLLSLITPTLALAASRYRITCKVNGETTVSKFAANANEMRVEWWGSTGTDPVDSWQAPVTAGSTWSQLTPSGAVKVSVFFYTDSTKIGQFTMGCR